MVVNVAPFLTPLEAVRVFSRLSQSTRAVSLESSCNFWLLPELLSSLSPVEHIRRGLAVRNQEARALLLSELYLALSIEPIPVCSIRAGNDDKLMHVLGRRGETGLLQLVARMDPSFDPNETGSGGMTALHCCAFSKSMNACKFLIQSGADPNIKDSIGRLAEDWATVQQAHELATFLRRSRKGKLGRLTN